MYNPKIHLFPGDLDGESYGQWSAREFEWPTELGVLVCLLGFPGSGLMRRDDLRRDALRKVRSAMKLIDGRPVDGRRIEVMMDYAVVDLAPPPLPHLLTAPQTAWLVDRLYVQVGFVKPGRMVDFGIAEAVATSLTLYDCLALRHGSVHSVDHEPLELPGDSVRSLRVAMGRHFQEGSVIMSEKLLPYRDKVAVMCRAALAGEDPIAAYQDFLGRSQPYFIGFTPRDYTGKSETYVTVEGGPENGMWAAVDGGGE